MQAHQETLKKYGHMRRPSYGSGKTMPISSLLIDVSAPASAQRSYETFSKDGLSPTKVATDQPVIFTFGQGRAQQSDASNAFLLQEQSAGIAQRVEAEEPQQPVFLKCTNYHSHASTEDQNDDEESTAESSSVTDTTDTDTGDSDNEHETAESDYDLSSARKGTEQPQQKRLSRSTSERQDFLASMLFNASDEPVGQTAESASNVDKPAPTAPMAESESSEEEEKDAQPIVTEPDEDVDEVDGEVELVFREQHFAPIAMGSNDTEPSDSDPFEVDAIITYPEEKFRVVADNEDLITFDENDHVVAVESQLTIENLAKFDREYFRNKLAVAEALAQASMLTPTAVRRRLAARQMEMNINHTDGGDDTVDASGEYIPPKDLLLYLVR